jgi:hypothetical protein
MDSEKRIIDMLKRIKASQDGLDFIEYLQTLSLKNYKAFKVNNPEHNELHKGYAIAIDNLIECFEQCDRSEETTKVLNEWA